MLRKARLGYQYVEIAVAPRQTRTGSLIPGPASFGRGTKNSREERQTLAIPGTRVHAPRHASDETDALRYLNAHGLRFTTFDEPISALLRAERVRILKRSIPWAPTDPLPHGRRWDYLAEAIPESIWSNWTPDRSHPWGQCRGIGPQDTPLELRLVPPAAPARGRRPELGYIFSKVGP